MAEGWVGAASGVSFSRHSLKETTLEGGQSHINLSFLQLIMGVNVQVAGGGHTLADTASVVNAAQLQASWGLGTRYFIF